MPVIINRVLAHYNNFLFFFNLYLLRMSEVNEYSLKGLYFVRNAKKNNKNLYKNTFLGVFQGPD